MRSGLFLTVTVSLKLKVGLDISVVYSRVMSCLILNEERIYNSLQALAINCMKIDSRSSLEGSFHAMPYFGMYFSQILLHSKSCA